MGLTNGQSAGINASDTKFGYKNKINDKVLQLRNPNVGKSTVFNAVNGLPTY